MHGRQAALGYVTLAVCAAWAANAEAQLASHPAVAGDDVAEVEIADAPTEPISFRRVTWDALSRWRLPKGKVRIRFTVTNRPAVEIPVCAGRGRLSIDGVESAAPAGPVVVKLGGGAHRVELEIAVGSYMRRVACSSPPRVGDTVDSTEGLAPFTFASTHDGGGRAVVYVPPGHDRRKPSALLVGLHPWNSDMWSYAAFGELLAEARARDVILLMPSGLGNSLYTANAEEEVLAAIDALARAVAVDPRRVSIWGASMGGAGATTIGFHHPDRFATITSFFGDSKYDLGTYVKGILRDEPHAHLVNALDIVDNARNVPVWLIHGEEDAVSPIAQSEMLAKALTARRFAVRFDRVPHAGHDGALVARFAAEVVDRASDARAPDAPARVTYTSVRPTDTAVYAIRFARAGVEDATIDLERREDGVHVVRASGVRSVVLPRGAFGAPPSRTPPIVIDDPGARAVSIGWDPVPSERDAR